MLYQALKLIIDRCGTDDVKLFKFFNYIKTFPSQLDMDIDDTVFNGVCKNRFKNYWCVLWTNMDR